MRRSPVKFLPRTAKRLKIEIGVILLPISPPVAASILRRIASLPR